MRPHGFLHRPRGGKVFQIEADAAGRVGLLERDGEEVIHVRLHHQAGANHRQTRAVRAQGQEEFPGRQAGGWRGARNPEAPTPVIAGGKLKLRGDVGRVRRHGGAARVGLPREVRDRERRMIRQAEVARGGTAEVGGGGVGVSGQRDGAVKVRARAARGQDVGADSAALNRQTQVVATGVARESWIGFEAPVANGLRFRAGNPGRQQGQQAAESEASRDGHRHAGGLAYGVERGVERCVLRAVHGLKASVGRRALSSGSMSMSSWKKYDTRFTRSKL